MSLTHEHMNQHRSFRAKHSCCHMKNVSGVFLQRTSLRATVGQIFSGLEMQKHGTACGKLVMMPGTLLWLSGLAAR